MAVWKCTDSTSDAFELKLENLKVSGEIIGWKFKNKLVKIFKSVWFVSGLMICGTVMVILSIFNGIRRRG